MDLNEIIKKAEQLLAESPELAANCTNPHLHLIDNHDESKIMVYQISWKYPDDIDLNYKIAYQSGVLANDLCQWFVQQNPLFTQVYKYGSEHFIYVNQGDTFSVHSEDNTLQIIATITGQW